MDVHVYVCMLLEYLRVCDCTLTSSSTFSWWLRRGHVYGGQAAASGCFFNLHPIMLSLHLTNE